MGPIQKRTRRFRFSAKRGDRLNDVNFTQRAQTALRLAQESAAELGHGYVGT